MRNTNFQNLRELLDGYTPEIFGIVSTEECNLIRNGLELEGMEIIDLRNLRDFAVLFFSRNNRDGEDMADLDRMSAIIAVIDTEIMKRGGKV